MAETNPLKPLLKEIANAIREKEESTDSIPAEDFPDRIRAIDTIPENVRTITVKADPPESGNVSGGGVASDGMTITVHADAAHTHRFVDWERDGVPISNDESYSFIVSSDLELLAVFAEKPVLPDGYTALAWISPSDTTAKLSLGILLNSNMKLDVVVSIPKIMDGLIFSAYRKESGANYGQLGVGADGGSMRCLSGWSNSISPKYLNSSKAIIIDSPIKCTYNVKTKSYDLGGDNIPLENSTAKLSYYYSTSPVYLGAAWSSAVSNTAAQILSVTAYNSSGSVYRDYIPCKDPSGVVGIYDKVSESFLGPEDANHPFTAGPAV